MKKQGAIWRGGCSGFRVFSLVIVENRSSRRPSLPCWVQRNAKTASRFYANRVPASTLFD